MSSFSKHNIAYEVVDTADLKIGMYVTELDRPWLGTPFLLEGVLIENALHIEQLCQFCQKVLVDRSRSVADQHSPRARGGHAARVGGQTSIAMERSSDESEFLSIARQIRNADDAFGKRAQRPIGRASALEEEMLYSASVVDDVHRTLESVQRAVNSDGHIDLSKVRGLVAEMAAGVERNQDAMLWLTRLKITDQYSYDHAVDVSVHMMVFGRFLGLGSEAIEALGQAGLMQDIGKISLDPEILGKPSALTDEEYMEVQSHVASCLEMLANVQHSFSDEVLRIIAAHHERHDGSGYPEHLRGDKISLNASIAGMIDTYCAITRHRVFCAAISSQKALEMLSRMRGKQFREVVVDQFVQCVGLYPIGTLVELNTGEVAVVIQQNQVRRLRPRLLILMAPDKTLERRPRGLNLMLEPTTPTGELYRIRQALPSNAYGIDPAEFFLD